MSHQTGIQANKELHEFFGKCRDGKVRLIKVGIHNEELTLDEYKDTEGTCEDDYMKCARSLFKEKQPCYVLYRLDNMNDTGYEWILISWSPDDSPVREKMLYASTKATLKKEFGGGQIKDELFATIKEDTNLRCLKKILSGEKSPPPLTTAEEELQMIKKCEVGADISLESKQQIIQGLAFPISSDAMAALTDLKEGIVTYVQLSIDLEKEIINVEMKATKDVHSLSQIVPKDHARYHLFTFPHSYEGDYQISIVFIYSVPGCNCPVRERMLYSSCKHPLLDTIEKVVGIEIGKKIETDDPTELTEEFLLDELHPKTIIFKQKFAKPKGPGHRGSRRLIKTPPSEGD